ncbi:MAG: gliding motility protein GldL [Paludibacteraceae bacterium]|nr:gliding motility protein GldL [Paludibacteraceae bacterium]
MATVNQNAYESWYNSFEGENEGKFMTWYHSYEGKKIINIIYSAGASVVIIGALFKILHWPGASIVLMLGMFTEAFLFLIGVLEAPHEEFHWANVFPQLIEYGSPEARVKRSKEQLGMAPMGGAAGEAPKAGVSALSDSELEALKGSLNDLAKTAGQLSELGKLATSTNKLGEKMDAASEAAAKYAESAISLGDKSAALSEAYNSIASNMQNMVAGSQACEKEMGAMSQKISSLNAVYELQLNAANAQVEAYKAQASEIATATQKIQAVGANYDKMQAAAGEAMKAQEDFDAAQKKLAQQVADLNKVYGNMLNALA